MQITKFRRVGAGGRRIAKFTVRPEIVELRDLTLIRNANGELRVHGKAIESMLAEIGNAALAHAEAQHD